jgi:hypothetical protein
MKKTEKILMEVRRSDTENLVVIDGITRAGKFWMGNMLIHFEGVEHMQHYPAMDMFVHMHQIGALSDNAAESLLQNETSARMYEMAIGRNINFRFADSSSVYRNPNLKMYLQRSSGPDVNPRDTEKQINSGRNVFLFIVHDWLCNPGICFESFPKLKIVYMDRNPVDLVYAWYRKGHGNRNAFSCGIDGRKGPLPWFAYPWMDEYERLNEIDRSIMSIATLDDMAHKGFKTLPKAQKNRILFTSYEDLATKPQETAEKISAFLGREPMATIKMFFSQDIFKQRTNAAINKSRKEKLETIKEKASQKKLELLLKLEREYKRTSWK